MKKPIRRLRRSRSFPLEMTPLEDRRLLSYVPAGPAFQLNQVSEGGQYSERGAAGPQGQMMIAWDDFGLDSAGNGIYARRLDSSGKAAGDQFRVNTIFEGDQTSPVVGSDAAGNTIIVWRDSNVGGAGVPGMMYQRFDPQGAKVGANTALPNGGNYSPVFVFFGPAGDFTVVGTDGPANLAFRHYDASGAYLGGGNQVIDTPGWSASGNPLHAAMSGGVIEYTWSEERSYTVPDVGTRIDGRTWMRRLDMNGAQIGPDVLLLSATAVENNNLTYNLRPTPVALADGGTIVTWYQRPAVGSGSAFVGQRYDADGRAVGGVMSFSPQIPGGYGGGDTGYLVQLANGNLLAVLEQENPFESDTSYFRIFDLNGNPLSDKVQMPGVTAYYLGINMITPTGGGDFVIGWGDQANPPYNGEVYVQKFIDDNKTIQFTTNTARAAEAAGQVAIAVTRTGDLSSPASVLYATTDETATAGSDYATVFGTLNFAAGQSSAVITVPILNDGAIEPAETFRLVLSNAVGAGLGAAISVQVTIDDDDARPLFVDFGASGLWRWSVAAGFTKLNNADPQNIAAGPSGDLFVDFGASGLWRWSVPGGFQQLNAADPQNIAAGSGGELYVDFGAFGLWRWAAPSGLQKLSGADPEAMVANPAGGLYLDFGASGVWRWGVPAGFLKLNGANPETLAAAPDGSLYLDFGASGLWRWTPTSGFQQLSGANAEGLTYGPDGKLYLDFGASGFWSWSTSTGFLKLNGANPEAFTAGSDGFVYLDFAASGLWRWSAAAGFVKLNAADPSSIALA